MAFVNKKPINYAYNKYSLESSRGFFYLRRIL